ncbi:unnamed protein product [Prunus armeniaca]|uniref:Uncharacterized protein n=1 Tax=Prunus armeniaca TaxID=36596 RepID=A0A6J5UCC9_PRUAR|nr:unnamed protein product [Prunus armeniaca]
MVDDAIQFHGDVLMGGFSPLVDGAQSFKEQAEFGSYNQERTECIESDETHATQQGLTDNNIGAAATEETGCQFGSENSQPDNVDFSIDYGWLHHLIQVVMMMLLQPHHRDHKASTRMMKRGLHMIHPPNHSPLSLHLNLGCHQKIILVLNLELVLKVLKSMRQSSRFTMKICSIS